MASRAVDLKQFVRSGGLREESAYRCTCDLLCSAGPTAIVSVNNVSTIGVIRAATEKGLAIPHQLSIVGFDDFPLAGLFTPPLTVIVQPTAEIGAYAGQLLHERLIKPGAPPKSVVLKTKFIERASSVAPIERGRIPLSARAAGESR